MILEKHFTTMIGAAFKHLVFEVFLQGNFKFPYRLLVQGKKSGFAFTQCFLLKPNIIVLLFLLA